MRNTYRIISIALLLLNLACLCEAGNDREGIVHVCFARYQIEHYTENGKSELVTDSGILKNADSCILGNPPKFSNYRKLDHNNPPANNHFISKWIKGGGEAQLRFDVFSEAKRSTTLPMNGILHISPRIADDETAPVWEFAVSFASVSESKIPEAKSPFAGPCYHYVYRFTVKPLRILPNKRMYPTAPVMTR